jgi:hypothetical protein
MRAANLTVGVGVSLADEVMLVDEATFLSTKRLFLEHRYARSPFSLHFGRNIGQGKVLVVAMPLNHFSRTILTLFSTVLN